MRHATQRAIEAIRGRLTESAQIKARTMTAACDGALLSYTDSVYGDGEALRDLGSQRFHGLRNGPPDCPLCRVLLDQALDAPDAKPLDFTGATP